MGDIRKLFDLLARVPILHVDAKAARSRGDHEAARYAEAVTRWQADAERLLEAVEDPRAHHPDAYQRAALASQLGQMPA